MTLKNTLTPCVLLLALLIGASFPLRVGSAQFIDRITRPCSSGVTSRALVITNPNNTGNVEITTCTGGSVTINGTAVVPGGATINPTNTFIPYRSNATTFLDSPLARTSATVITSTAAFNGPVGGVNTATYSFAAEATLGLFRRGAGQLGVTAAGTVGWFDSTGWHGPGTMVEVINDTATSTDGFIATTNGNATVGVQKLSPRIRLSGSGWKTDAVAGAQMTDWIIENTPVQGTANPSTNLVFSSQVNAGGYTPKVTLSSSGNVGVGTMNPVGALTISKTIAQGASYIYLDFPSANNSWVGGITFRDASGTEGYTMSQGQLVASNTLEFRRGATATMVLDPNGNVGIGTLAGLSTLSINGGLHVGGDSDAGDNNLIVDGSILATNATLTGYRTTTNCADSAGAAACGAAAAGAVVIDAGSTSVVVSTTAVTATSRVMVVFDSGLGTELGVTCNTTAALPFVTARTAATSFTITVGVAPAVNPGCFTYWIVN